MKFLKELYAFFTDRDVAVAMLVFAAITALTCLAINDQHERIKARSVEIAKKYQQ